MRGFRTWAASGNANVVIAALMALMGILKAVDGVWWAAIVFWLVGAANVWRSVNPRRKLF